MTAAACYDRGAFDFRMVIRLGEAKRKKARMAGSANDPAVRKAIVTQAFDQTCKAIARTPNDPIAALIQTHRGRNAALRDLCTAHAALNKAECQEGCSSCCHQMVACSPFEAFMIARHLLDTQSQESTAELKRRLGKHAQLPLDPYVRDDAPNPCPLLVDKRCSIYDHRPAVCRVMLSASRSACDACLEIKGSGKIPYIATPMQINVMMQLGIDYALITRLHLNTDPVELSRAVLIALEDFDGSLTTWGNGGDPFPNCKVRPPGSMSLQEMAAATAKRFGLS